jgi:serine/threonine protein kinase
MAATELGPGATFGTDGRYRIERLLSTGGMATVWLARDTRLRRPVAMKFLSDVLALDRDYVTRFAREARVAAQLSHPHLVSVYDFSGEGARPFLVMEYIAGGTLGERLRNGSAPGLDAEQVTRDLLGALAYIHSAGVVHRDVKPANVLLGPDGRVRLTDFGIAQPSAATRMTETGMVLGTARYLAPELLRGERADARSDLYACGVLLGQLLPEHPLPELAALTEAEPAQRPQSAAEALAQLDTASEGRTAPTRRMPQAARGDPATAPRMPHVVRDGRDIRVRLPRSAAAVLAGLALVVVLIVVLTQSGGGGSPPASRPAPPARSAPLSRQLDYLDQAIDAAQR